MQNAFNSFAAEIIPLIDGIIKDFYDRKIKNADRPFMKEIYADIASYCLRKGKRLRPILLLASYEGYKKGKKARNEMALPAAALEMMHSFLLIQDDIIDKSDTRRGEKAMHIITGRYAPLTYNKNIGADVAVIAADVLFSNALELTAAADICNRARRRFLSVFAETYEMTAWGQILDILNSKAKAISPEENIPLDISLMKTAYYTVCYPLLMGNVLATTGPISEKKAIEKFAIPLGLAFQIRDDILGVFGSEEETGKPSDSDINEGKYTLLIRNTIERLQGKKRDDFTQKFLSLKKSKTDAAGIRSAIVSSGGLDFTKEKQASLIDEALAAIGGLAMSQSSRKILEGLAVLLRL
ncbi:MAG: polyprenyl synthetase family protein [Spirochaetia bacterium]|jgi:geranylgeranyl diphosphate synthase type I|nr:polyprenyl synthetase family protein [Spirochaetia bacterium]